jgi:hypothetical protein
MSAERPGPAGYPSEGWSRPLRFWVAAWSVVACALAAALALGPLAGIPHVQDEVVYTLQARNLAHGTLWSAVPEPRATHVYDFLLDTGRGRAGIFPNGWPAVLALGVLAGAPWSVDPLLAGLVVAVGGSLALRWGGRPGAFLAAPLLALSPQALLLGASRMSHTLCALLVLLALHALPSRGETFGAGRGLALGASLAALALVRPWDAVLVAAVLLSAAVALRPRRAAMLTCGSMLVLGGGVAAAQNLALTGDALTFAQTRYFETAAPPLPGNAWRFAPGCNALGFGPDRGCFRTWGSYGYTARKAVRNLAVNAVLAGCLWLGTPLALLLALAPFAWRELRSPAFVTWSLVAAILLGYSLYWYDGACFGARFWHVALAPVVILTALAAARVLKSVGFGPGLGLLLLLPMASRLTGTLPELHRYWGVDDRFVRLEERWDRGEALVLVAYRGEILATHPRQTTAQDLLVGPHRWRADWFLVGGPLHFEEYQPALVDAVERRYPHRPVWIYEMAADPSEDRFRPIEPSDRAPRQLADLPLPVSLPLIPPPVRRGDLWTGHYRVVDVDDARD